NCTSSAPTTLLHPPTTGYTTSPWGSPGTPPGGAGASLGGGNTGGGGPGGSGGTAAGGGVSNPGTGANGGGGVPAGGAVGAAGGALVQLGQSSVGTLAEGAKKGTKDALDQVAEETDLGSVTDPVFDATVTPPTENKWVQLVDRKS